MKVRLADIPPAGLKINDTISLSSLNSRMREGSGNDIEFLSPPRVKIVIRLERDNVENGGFLQGTVTTSYLQPCPRCLTSLTRDLQAEIDLILKPQPKAALHRKDRGSFQEDVGIAYFEAEHIELEELLQEALILELSPFGFEHAGCPGAQAAAADPGAKGSNMGELLQQAGIKTSNSEKNR